MVFNHNYKSLKKDIYAAWWLRQMCKDLKDYLLSVSFDSAYSPVVYLIGEMGVGEVAEILAQEFPFLKIHCLSEWVGEDAKYENEFDERVKFYDNIIKDKGKIEEFIDEIYSPAMVYIASCNDASCLQQDLDFWKPGLRKGAIMAGGHYAWKHYRNHKLFFEVQKVVINTFYSEPDKKYTDGSWYKII
jgi:hypothetical protein